MEEFLTEVEYNRLSEMLDVLCSGLAETELKYLKTCTTTHLAKCLQNEIKDGRDLAIVLRRYGICDETNIQNVRTALKHLNRYDLLRMAWCHERKSLKVNLLEEFLHQESRQREKKEVTPKPESEKPISTSKRRLRSSENVESEQTTEEIRNTRKKRSRTSNVTFESSNTDVTVEPQVNPAASTASTTADSSEIKSRYTCDVRLRVWAEYCNHERHLNENVFSNKEEPFERQLERFSQASSIIQSRELGYIVCDIKFSEITYLDAFWRDYLNGSLLEALKGVFITESLKQAVGNEPIKLLVSVDEEDYEEGRHILLGNVYCDSGQEMPPFY